jgi:hypothetical protein
MQRDMPPESVVVVTAFVAAYEPYLRRVAAERGYRVPDGWAQIVAQGRAGLEAALRELLSAPYADQRRSPLEVFQEAMQGPTEALATTGVDPADRDETARSALPGDHFGLAPASSQDLGRDAWEAHLAWGVAKARDVAGVVPATEAPPAPRPVSSVRRRAVALVGTDLMDRSRIEPIVHAAGFSLEVWRNPAAIEEGLAGTAPVVALVDLRHPASDEAIRRAAAAGVRTFAFGPHVDDVALAGARSLGATDALTRAQFFRRLAALLPAQA